MYWPVGEATIISPGLPPESRSITAPCPAKMPRVGNVTAVVNPAPRTASMRESLPLISSAIFTQLVVAGRSSGPRAGVTVVAAVVGATPATAARVAAVVGVAGVWPRPPRPAAAPVAGAGAPPGCPQVLRPSIRPG